MKMKNTKKFIKTLETDKFLSLALALAILLIVFSYFSLFVSGGVGQNVTVITELTVGNTWPEILNVSIEGDASSFILTANSTKTLRCEALLRDYNNDTDFDTVSAEFFNSSYGASDDKNNHYTNSSCYINRTFGTWRGISDDNYTALANCTFSIWYYANPGNWNCTVLVNDSVNWNATGSDSISIAELLAFTLPESINYGLVNATSVSAEKVANVSNAGNVRLNLSLDGYAVNRYDNWSMNCSGGTIKNISIYYERYNLTDSTPGSLTLAQFGANYTNLTSTPTVKKFDLNYRQDDTYDEAVNATYWRIYVPVGVAGTCRGNIVFGATRASGS